MPTSVGPAASTLPSRAARILRFLRSQFFVTPALPTRSWAGKVVIVTGANRGLGLEAARHFVRLDARKVILAVRDLDAGRRAKTEIEQSVGAGTPPTTGEHGSNPQKGPGAGSRGADGSGREVVDVWPLDLSSPQSIEAFARRASRSLDRLDALVENAGVATRTFRLVADDDAADRVGNTTQGPSRGRESTVAVNVVGPMHLALLLLPTLRQTAATYQDAGEDGRPHITIVCSELIFFTSLPSRPRIFERLDEPASAVRMLSRYQVTKLMAAMCARELAARIPETQPHGDAPPRPEVVVNYVNPGFCRSDMLRRVAAPAGVLHSLLARSAEVGSRALVHAASAGAASHGQYLSDCGVQDPPPVLMSEEGIRTQAQVWEELVDILEERHPGICTNLTSKPA